MNPDREYVVTANNRVAANDFPYPLAGTWASGDRARRIREMLEEKSALEIADHRRMQYDAHSLRAVNCVSSLCAVLARDPREDMRRAVALLKDWDGECDPELVAPAIFNIFFVEWCQRVAAELLPMEVVPLLVGGIDGLAAELLQVDRCGWFSERDCEVAIRETFAATLDRLCTRLGNDSSQWTWGRLHRLDLKHTLATRGELGELLNGPGAGVPGDMTTVCNTGRGANFEASAGAGYRMICDLGESPAGLWAIDCQSQSGHPGSPHYSDQFSDWLSGKYHFIPLDRTFGNASRKLRLEPK